MPKSQNSNKKGKQSNFSKLSIFQPNKYKFKKTCPFSIKGAPKIDYKNIKLLKKYVSENGKSFHQGLQTYHRKNKENYLYQLKELEIWLYYNESNIIRKRKKNWIYW